MSELKALHAFDVYDAYTKTGDDDAAQVYLKSEADKVIAEKDKEIAKLQKQVHDYAQGLYVIQASAEKEARHHKHKRCLAMAMWCSAELGMLVSTWEFKIKHYKKWQKRWLKIAEKFKEE